MVLVDLRPKGVTGRDAERALERAGLTCNKNAIPFDPEKPFVTSGVRLGTSAGTTRGFGEAEFARVGELVLKVVDALAASGAEGDAAVEAEVLAEVRKLCRRPPDLRRLRRQPRFRAANAARKCCPINRLTRVSRACDDLAERPMFLSVFDIFKIGVGPSSLAHHGPDARPPPASSTRSATAPTACPAPARPPGSKRRCTAASPSPARATPPTAP